ncbi:MAG TPA: hypothetical protein VIF57_09215 [Polyangia bacterium]
MSRRLLPSSIALMAAILLGVPRPSRADTAAAKPAPPSALDVTLPLAAASAGASELPEAPEPEEQPEEVSASLAPAPVASPLVITGYVDVGYAKAQGDGTSFPAGDTRVPADYGVDPFATAVNSRGEVASTDAGGRFTNGFLPRSAGIGGTPSFLINTASFDVRYTPAQAPVMVFTRVQLLPRFENPGQSSSTGTGSSVATTTQNMAAFQRTLEGTRVFVEQAFGRVTPLKSAELAISLGKFDSVFGIEYLDNQANFRIGITPSLMARYTTGQSIGAKVFFRRQFMTGTAVSINAAATNSGTFVEALQGPDRSLTGVPVASARLGLEHNLARVSVKVGASGSYGPRNDQLDREALQRLWGADARLYAFGLSLSGEYVHVQEDEGSADGKVTGLGVFPFGSGFQARGFWTQLAYEIPVPGAPLRFVPYGRYERRHAQFQGFVPVDVDRATFGLHVDLWDNVQLKGEVVLNRELDSTPSVPNNVYTSSAVWTW